MNRVLAIVLGAIFSIIILFSFYIEHTKAFFHILKTDYLTLLLLSLIISIIFLTELLYQKKFFASSSIILIYFLIFYILLKTSTFPRFENPESIYVTIYTVIILIGLLFFSFVVIFNFQLNQLNLNHLFIPVIFLILGIGIILINDLNLESPIKSKFVTCDQKTKSGNPNEHSINNSWDSISSNYFFNCQLNNKSENLTIFYRFEGEASKKTTLSVDNNFEFEIRTPKITGEYTFEVFSIEHQKNILNTIVNIVPFEDFIEAKKDTEKQKLAILLSTIIVAFIAIDSMIRIKEKVNKYEDRSIIKDKSLLEEIKKDNEKILEEFKDIDKILKDMLKKINKILKKGRER